MPHKLEKYRSYDTPYGKSYSADTKLWYNDSETFLMNIFDGVIDKQYFVISLRAVLKSAENYLLYYIEKYAGERNLPKDLVKKAKIYAKNCK